MMDFEEKPEESCEQFVHESSFIAQTLYLPPKQLLMLKAV
jgi:hypothetical protein